MDGGTALTSLGKFNRLAHWQRPTSTNHAPVLALGAEVWWRLGGAGAGAISAPIAKAELQDY